MKVESIRPCLFCGQCCGSQLEHLEAGQSQFDYCSACDPELVEEEGTDPRQRVFTFYPAPA